MGRKLGTLIRSLAPDDSPGVVAATVHRVKRRRPRSRRRLERPAPARAEPAQFVPLPSLLRNRSLLMAALRVWELRHGIRSTW